MRVGLGVAGSREECWGFRVRASSEVRSGCRVYG